MFVFKWWYIQSFFKASAESVLLLFPSSFCQSSEHDQVLNHFLWGNQKCNSPKSDRTPQAIHTVRDIPTLPECFRIPLGEMKIPAPMMVPTMMEIPRSRVTFLPSSTFFPPPSCSFPRGSFPFWENVCPVEAVSSSFLIEVNLFIFLNAACAQSLFLFELECLSDGACEGTTSPGLKRFLTVTVHAKGSLSCSFLKSAAPYSTLWHHPTFLSLFIGLPDFCLFVLPHVLLLVLPPLSESCLPSKTSGWF